MVYCLARDLFFLQKYTQRNILIARKNSHINNLSENYQRRDSKFAGPPPFEKSFCFILDGFVDFEFAADLVANVGKRADLEDCQKFTYLRNL